jgi:hypothetical protein
MTRRALLIPDCGVGTGLGHLERALALADALREGRRMAACGRRLVDCRGALRVAHAVRALTRTQVAR